MRRASYAANEIIYKPLCHGNMYGVIKAILRSMGMDLASHCPHIDDMAIVEEAAKRCATQRRSIWHNFTRYKKVKKISEKRGTRMQGFTKIDLAILLIYLAAVLFYRDSFRKKK